ncbi:hypothetical protein AKJ16_DCAP24045 [Drosera capensis]
MGRKPRTMKLEKMSPSATGKAQSQSEINQDSIGPESGETNTNLQKCDSLKKLKRAPATVRKSRRVLNASRDVENLGIQSIPQEINLDESDEHQPPKEEENKSYDEQQELAILRSHGNGIPGGVDGDFRRMFADSQKQIEALKDTNNDLCMKLENALGKLEAYEKGDKVFSEIRTVLSSLSKTMETAVSRSAEAVRGSSIWKTNDIAPKTVKRKRGSSYSEDPLAL